MTRFSSNLELIVGFFLDYESVESLEEFVEEQYDRSEYKLTWTFCC